MAKNNGGPAFPEVFSEERGEHGERGYEVCSTGGMSLRDWFAGQALAGMIANPDFGQPTDEARRLGKFASKAATLCYELADAMLAERAKPSDPAYL